MDKSNVTHYHRFVYAVPVDFAVIVELGVPLLRPNGEPSVLPIFEIIEGFTGASDVLSSRTLFTPMLKQILPRLRNPIIRAWHLNILDIAAVTCRCSPDEACNNAAILNKPSRPSVMCEIVFETRHSVRHGPQDLRRRARIAMDEADQDQKSTAADGAVNTNHCPLIATMHNFAVKIHSNVGNSSADVLSQRTPKRYKEMKENPKPY